MRVSVRIPAVSGIGRDIGRQALALILLEALLVLLTPMPARSEEPWMLWVSSRTSVFQVDPDKTDAMPRRVGSSEQKALVPNQLSNQTADQCRHLLQVTRDRLASRLRAESPTLAFTVDEDKVEVATRDRGLVSVTTHLYHCAPLNSRP